MAATIHDSDSPRLQGLVEPFLEVIRGSQPYTLPQETLLGAITHFLSHLNATQLPAFIEAIATSPSLWAQSEIEGLLEAIRLAPAAKLASLEDRYADSYFPSIRRRRVARSWLEAICNGLTSATTEPLRIAEILVALLEGVDGTDHTWDTSRERLEDEVVMALAGSTSEGARFTEVLGRSMDHVNESKLRLLEWQVRRADQVETKRQKLLPMLRERFFAVETGLDSYPTQLARVLGRALQVVEHGGPSSRQQSLFTMAEITRDMRLLAHQAERAHSDTKQPPDAKNEKRRRQSSEAFVALSAYLIDILRSENASAVSSEADHIRPSLLAADLLATIVASADIADNTSHDHAHVYAGVLDVLSATATTSQVALLLEEILSEPFASPARATLILGVAEQLVDKLNARALRLLLPVAEEYVRRPDCTSAFEAAHSFLKAVLDSTSRSLQISDAQAAFFDDVLRFYSPLLLKQMMRGDVSGERFQNGYASLAVSASRRSPSHTQYILGLLDFPLTGPNQRTLDLSRIAVTPSVSLDHLQLHLDRLAKIIMSASGGEQDQLAQAAHKMVMEGLGDQSKKVGMQWWLDWRSRFGVQPLAHLRAKL